MRLWIRGFTRQAARVVCVVGLSATLQVIASGAPGITPAAQARVPQFLGPAPVPCTAGIQTFCTYNSRCAPVSFSPHIVHVGEDIVGDAGPATDQCGPGGAKAVSWSWGVGAGVTVAKGCGIKSESCTLKATDATPLDPQTRSHYTIACIQGTSGFGPWSSCDYYAVIGAHERAISGEVRTKRGKPVAGAEVSIDGPSRSFERTNADGYYSVIVDPGHYRVSVHGVRDTASFCSGHSVGTTCDLNLDKTDGQADFTAPPDKIELHFSPSHAPADGMSHFEGTIDTINSAEQPAAGTDVKVTPPLDASPLALVCAGGKVLYPQLLSDGSPLGSPFTVATDANGQVPMTVWPGTADGHWPLHAAEANDASVSDEASFPFDSSGAGRVPPLDQIPTDFYNAIRHGVSPGIGAIQVQLNKLPAPTEAVVQDLLLNWLIATGHSVIPGVDFGPVSYAGHAGILFYPRGSASPTAGPTGVLDIRDAEAIVEAADGGQPQPAANGVGRTLDQWTMYVSGAKTPPPGRSVLGPIAAWTGDQYAYFGFPYPRSVLDTAGQAEFYNSCAAPDGTPQIVQTHSPVTLMFSAASGQTFGLDAHGHLAGNGTGMIFHQGDTTTYVVPGGTYSSAKITGTGNGAAHVEVFGIVGSTLTSYARQIDNYAFTAHTGATGTVPLNFFGPAGAVSYRGRTVARRLGLPLTLSGVPRKLRHGRRTFNVTVTSLGESIKGVVVTLTVKGHKLTGVTDKRGHVRFHLTVPSGRLSVTARFPGASAGTAALKVR